MSALSLANVSGGGFHSGNCEQRAQRYDHYTAFPFRLFFFLFFDTKSSAPAHTHTHTKKIGSFSLGGGSHKQDEDYAEHRLYGVRCVIDEEELEAGCS